MDDTENLRILRDMAMGRDVSAGDRVMAANWAVREIEKMTACDEQELIDDNEKLEQIYYEACREFPNLTGLRAVAEAAVRAEREGAEPFGWYFMDDPKVYTMPGSGFRVGPDRPADTLHASPLYLHPPQASTTVPEWQPIETAPKDGRTILLGTYNSHGNWRTMRGQWMSLDYIAEYFEEPDDVEEGWFETCVEADEPPNCWPVAPTHWMPLPAAPRHEAQT